MHEKAKAIHPMGPRVTDVKTLFIVFPLVVLGFRLVVHWCFIGVPWFSFAFPGFSKFVLGLSLFFH